MAIFSVSGGVNSNVMTLSDDLSVQAKSPAVEFFERWRMRQQQAGNLIIEDLTLGTGTAQVRYRGETSDVSEMTLTAPARQYALVEVSAQQPISRLSVGDGAEALMASMELQLELACWDRVFTETLNGSNTNTAQGLIPLSTQVATATVATATEALAYFEDLAIDMKAGGATPDLLVIGKTGYGKLRETWRRFPGLRDDSRYGSVAGVEVFPVPDAMLPANTAFFGQFGRAANLAMRSEFEMFMHEDAAGFAPKGQVLFEGVLTVAVGLQAPSIYFRRVTGTNTLTSGTVPA